MTSGCVVELFAGAGGASAGVRAVVPGARHVSVDLDPAACAVMRAAWPDGEVHEGDVGAVLASGVLPRGPDLMWASPPCQPYSLAGRRRGAADERDCWPVTLEAVRVLQPERVAIENVIGAPVEAWRQQIADLGYHADVWTLDAADFGVPQRRRRHFVVGVRGIADELRAPRPTHSGVALAHAKWTTGTYWGEHGMAATSPGPMTAWERRALRCLPDGLVRWRTVRDALGGGNALPAVESWRLDLPSPSVLATEERGATQRADAIAKAGYRDPSVGAGPSRASDMLMLATGRRRLEPEECAILQDFPSDHPWSVVRTKGARYLCAGNAVPPALAAAVCSGLFRSVPFHIGTGDGQSVNIALARDVQNGSQEVSDE